MGTLARLLNERKWREATQYCSQQQGAALPEIREILTWPRLRLQGTPGDALIQCLREIPVPESAMLIAKNYGLGGTISAYGLIENPRPEVYPILKAQLSPPEEMYGEPELLLTMAQMPVPTEQRIADIQPYLEAKDYRARQAAVLSLALLDDPGSMERVVYELGTEAGGAKQTFLFVFYHFRAWRVPKFVPVLIPVLNDPMPLKDIGLREYDANGAEHALTPEELRYLRARDYALVIIAKTLKLGLPFEIKDNVTFTKEQRELVKQKLRDLGYKVTDEPYPATSA